MINVGSRFGDRSISRFRDKTVNSREREKLKETQRRYVSSSYIRNALYCISEINFFKKRSLPKPYRYMAGMMSYNLLCIRS